MSLPAIWCRRGPLVSVEGISGVGKTYLTDQLHTPTDNPDPAQPGANPAVVLAEFSQRYRDTDGDPGADVDVDVARQILRAMAADGDYFLRAGRPRSETLLLLAAKMHDYEHSRAALRRGQLVLEGRSVHSVAVYQALILHAEAHQALQEARAILDLASRWRPLPDLTILLTDDVDTAVARAERRDGNQFNADEWQVHRRAAALFEQLAADDPDRIRTIDRRELDAAAIVARMRRWIADLTGETSCIAAPWRHDLEGLACTARCRLAESAASA